MWLLERGTRCLHSFWEPATDLNPFFQDDSYAPLTSKFLHCMGNVFLPGNTMCQTTACRLATMSTAVEDAQKRTAN
jgi:hypothetical protein